MGKSSNYMVDFPASHGADDPGGYLGLGAEPSLTPKHASSMPSFFHHVSFITIQKMQNSVHHIFHQKLRLIDTFTT